MKKIALNPLRETGFQSKAQMRYLLRMAKEDPEKFSFVYDVLREHGVPSEDGPLHTYWTGPYNTSPETPSYVYTGRSASDLESFVKKAKAKVADFSRAPMYDDNRAKQVANQFWTIRGSEFSDSLTLDQMAEKLNSLEQFQPYSELDEATKQEARNYVGDFILGRKIEASQPISKTASYTDYVIRLFEGKSNKYSSVEEALSDFSSRLGLSSLDRDQLKKQALLKIAQLKTFEDEGITDPKAISYMSKAKNKHTNQSGSPFVVNKQNEKTLSDKLKKRKQDRSNNHEDPNQQASQANEFANNANSDGSASARLQVQRLEKLAEEFGKILPFNRAPSEQSIEQLKKELSATDIDTSFKISRYGFNFTDINGKYPQPGKPIRVTAYQYSFLKDNLIKLINDDLKKQLSQEMDFDGWISFLEEKVKTKQLPSTEGWELIDKLEKMKRQLYGDDKTRPFIIDEGGKRITQQIKKMLSWFPVSYRNKILKMMAEGKYRHLLSEASDKDHSSIFPTSYRRASFVLMDSFAPYNHIVFKPEKEKLKQLLQTIVTNKKQQYSQEEFIDILNSLDISYQLVPSSKEYQIVPLHSKVKIKIDASSNEGYKPSTFEDIGASAESKEKLLQQFHNQLMTAINSELPLVHEPQPDGSIKELYLDDIVNNKKDYTASSIAGEDKDSRISNPKSGMHPSFEGTIEQRSGEDLFENTRSKRKTPTPSSSKSKSPQDLQDLLQKLKNRQGSNKKYLNRYAESSGLWIDDRGRSFNSEDEMKTVLYKEMIEEASPKIIQEIVESLSNQIQDSSQPNIPNTVEQDKDLEQDQDQSSEQPLAANLKFKKVLAELALLKTKG